MTDRPEVAAPWARRWGPVLAWSAVILVMTSWPNPKVPVTFEGSDKMAHFGVYAILGWLAARAMLSPRRLPDMLVVAAGIAAFAMLDELHQLWIPNREAAYADWLADIVGASIGLAFHHLTHRSRLDSMRRRDA